MGEGIRWKYKKFDAREMGLSLGEGGAIWVRPTRVDRLFFGAAGGGGGRSGGGGGGGTHLARPPPFAARCSD